MWWCPPGGAGGTTRIYNQNIYIDKENSVIEYKKCLAADSRSPSTKIPQTSLPIFPQYGAGRSSPTGFLFRVILWFSVDSAICIWKQSVTDTAKPWPLLTSVTSMSSPAHGRILMDFFSFFAYFDSCIYEYIIFPPYLFYIIFCPSMFPKFSNLTDSICKLCLCLIQD